MFLDKVDIMIKAGDGGKGHTSFHRDKMTMRGGPDGGDGGKGGDIIFIGTTRADNLIEFRFKKKFHAVAGKPGGTRNCSGKGGEDMIIPVPLGTRIYKEGKTLVADITKVDQTFRALVGGAGGRGNAHYATAKKQSPNFSQTGVITKEHKITLELYSIADIGLIGFPNAGKSTLLKAVTRANPKIANYPFTTLHPNIGVANVHGSNLIIADIPGLIEGASKGAGLGHQFLKHINRTRALIHVVDISESEGRDALKDYEIINNELASFSQALADKPQIIALNKIDIATKDQLKKLEKAHKISAATHEGVAELMAAAYALIAKLPPREECEVTAILEEPVDKNQFEVTRNGNEFTVTGHLVDNMIRGIVLDDTESFAYFQRRLEQSGINAELKRLGICGGNVVHIANMEFEFVE